MPTNKEIAISIEAINAKLSILPGLQSSLQFISDKFDEALKEIKALKEENIRLQGNNKILNAKVEALELKIDENEQATKTKNIEIKGIPYKNGENTEEICKTLLGMLNKETDQTFNDIEACHRQHTKSEKSNIIVRLKNTKTKDSILKESKKQKLSIKSLGFQNDSPIFINEELTARRKELFYLALQKKRELKWKFLWSANGRILMRKTDSSKINPISVKQDLEKIQ